MESQSPDWGHPEQRDATQLTRFPKWFRRTVIVGLLAAAAALVAVLLVTRLGRDDPSHSVFADGPEARPVVARSDGYVGSSVCRTCHEDEFTSWHASYHRTMTQVASPQAIAGDFNNVALQIDGVRFQLTRDSEAHWIQFEEPQQDAGAEENETIRRKVVLTTGSHHMQLYWMSTGKGRELALLPFAWLIDEEEWIPRRAAFLKPSPDTVESAAELFEAGRWNHICIRCHSVRGIPGYDRQVPRETSVIDFGIACEACHGPGEAHVQIHDKGGSADTEDPIVLPTALVHQRASEVCGQCHSFITGPPGSEMQPTTYRPGMKLLDCQGLDTNAGNASRFWPDGMARVAGREYNGLIRSPCFEQGELSCFSCHTMHRHAGDARELSAWADDQLKPGMRSDQACLQCHDQFREDEALTAHTHHGQSSPGSRCYNCHMPHTSFGLLKAVRSHEISSPSTEETIVARRANACNLCHLDKSLAWSGQLLADWYGHQTPDERVVSSQIATSILMALRGDAASRALVAWHMGWTPARDVSGDQWMPPYLALLITEGDEYEAVRIIAQRSLNKIEGYQDIQLPVDATAEQRAEIQEEIRRRWIERMEQQGIDNPSLLLANGKLFANTIKGLLEQRDRRPVMIDE